MRDVHTVFASCHLTLTSCRDESKSTSGGTRQGRAANELDYLTANTNALRHETDGILPVATWANAVWKMVEDVNCARKRICTCMCSPLTLCVQRDRSSIPKRQREYNGEVSPPPESVLIVNRQHNAVSSHGFRDFLENQFSQFWNECFFRNRQLPHI